MGGWDNLKGEQLPIQLPSRKWDRPKGRAVDVPVRDARAPNALHNTFDSLSGIFPWVLLYFTYWLFSSSLPMHHNGQRNTMSGGRKLPLQPSLPTRAGEAKCFVQLSCLPPLPTGQGGVLRLFLQRRNCSLAGSSCFSHPSPQGLVKPQCDLEHGCL